MSSVIKSMYNLFILCYVFFDIHYLDKSIAHPKFINCTKLYIIIFNILYFNQWINYINQYLVGQPLLVITASILRGILSIKLIIWFIEILLHSSCKAVSNSVMFFITCGRFLILLPSSDHKCSIGFKSGDWLGQSGKTLILDAQFGDK